MYRFVKRFIAEFWMLLSITTVVLLAVLVSLAAGKASPEVVKAHVATSQSAAKSTQAASTVSTNQSSKPTSNSSTTVPTQATTSGVDFTLTPSAVTIASGGVTPTITVTSTNGKPLAWAPLGGNNFFVKDGWLFKSPEVSHSYTFQSSASLTKPGVYQVGIMGYIPKGPSVTKYVTVTVTQGPTFSLLARTPDYSQDTADTFYIPFQIQPVSGYSGPYTTTATLISSNGSFMQVQGVVDDYGPYFVNKKVAIYDDGQASGHLVVRVTVSDSLYSTSLDLPYDVQTN